VPRSVRATLAAIRGPEARTTTARLPYGSTNPRLIA
jgi:hypothetical protein